MRLNNNCLNLKKNTNRNGGYVFSGTLKVDFIYILVECFFEVKIIGLSLQFFEIQFDTSFLYSLENSVA